MRRIATGPAGHWLLGNLGEFRGDALKLLMESAERFGDVVRVRLGPRVVHLVNHPEPIEQVLLRRMHNYDKRTRSARVIAGVCGESVLTSDGAFWRGQRRLMQPAFHQERIAGFAGIMVELTAARLDRWRERAGSGVEFDVASEMSRLTYAVVGRALFGTDVGSEEESVERALGVLLDETYHRLERILPVWRWLPVASNLRFRSALAVIDRVVYRIIEERRRAPELGNDLLAMLLSARDEETGDGMSDEQLRNEAITLLLAGHETTANALAWTFYLLSGAPAVREKLRREVVEVLGGRRPGVEDLGRLKYTTMVIQEALRLYPPIWIFERCVKRDDEIGGYHIPGGSTVVVSPFALHRHPKFWPGAEEFRPERFEGGGGGRGLAEGYLPFGAGPHQCIGNHFAMMEARIILAMVTQRYRLELVAGHRVVPKPGITLRLEGGLKMVASDVAPK